MNECEVEEEEGNVAKKNEIRIDEQLMQRIVAKGLLKNTQS